MPSQDVRKRGLLPRRGRHAPQVNVAVVLDTTPTQFAFLGETQAELAILRSVREAKRLRTAKVRKIAPFGDSCKTYPTPRTL